MPRLYEPGVFVETLLADLGPSAVRKAVRNELRAGAHPFSLEQATRLAEADLDFQAARRLRDTVHGALAEAKPAAPVPEATGSGLTRSLSRAYRDGEPIELERGVLHGILTEALADMAERFREDKKSVREEWERGASSFAQSAVALPGMDFECLDTLLYVMLGISKVMGVRTLPFDYEDYWLSQFVKHRAATLPLKDFVKDLLGGWSDSASFRFWALFPLVFPELRERYERPGTEFVRALLAIRPRDGSQIYDAAGKVLLGQWSGASRASALNFRGAAAVELHVLHDMKREMPHRDTRRALIRWLQRLPSAERAVILFNLAFWLDRNSPYLDNRNESFVEEVFGREAWAALCLFQDPDLWKAATDGAGGASPTRVPDEITKACRSSSLTRHDPNVAEAFEDLLETSGVTADAATQTLEESLDILSGDLVVVVSHLRDEWMSVRRKDSELLGSVLSRIDVAKHPRFGDKNAACKFRIPLPDDARKVLKGTLDSEGEIFFENTPLLEAPAQLLVRAAVAQTLCAVLVPTLVEETVPPPTSSGPTVQSGRPWASRPTLRTEGEIGGTADVDVAEARGKRLNPAIAVALFRWLLGHGGGLTFRLFVETEEQIGTKPEKYFMHRPGARELLRRRQVTLSAAYIRAVRAHTQPTGAYLDEDEIRIRQVSARAERHYGRYRREGGRELDFSPVQKTYLLPNGMRVPLEIPRTFNQGHFISLEEAAELIFEPALQEAIRRSFAR